MEVHVRDKLLARHSLLHFRRVVHCRIPISLHAGRKLTELHHIASECSCLVGEEIPDLAKLFIQVGSLHNRRLIALRVVEIDIPGDEQRLPVLD